LAERGPSQANVSYSTKLCCAGFMQIIHKAVQDLNVVTPTV